VRREYVSVRIGKCYRNRKTGSEIFKTRGPIPEFGLFRASYETVNNMLTRTQPDAHADKATTFPL